MTADTEPDRRAWTWQYAVGCSDLPSTTKAVLYALMLFVSPAGTGCFPKIEKTANDRSGKLDLVTATGLSKRAVIEHLKAAEAAGWLARRHLGLRGQKWRQNEYELRWPERDLLTDLHDEKAGDGGSPASGDVVTLTHEGGDPDDTKVVTQDHQDKYQPRYQPIDQSIKTERESAREEPVGEPQEAGSAEGATGTKKSLPDADLLDGLKRAHPGASHEDQDEIDALWRAKAREDRRLAAKWHAAWLDDGAKGRKVTIGLRKYLAQDPWKLIAERAGAAEAAGPAYAAAFSRLWWWVFWRFVETWRADLGNRDSVRAVHLSRQCSGARSGLGWPVARERLADMERQAETLRQVASDGPAAFAARDVVRALGADMPLPDAAPYLWLPSEAALARLSGAKTLYDEEVEL